MTSWKCAYSALAARQWIRVHASATEHLESTIFHVKVDTARAVPTWSVDIICRLRMRQSLVRCLLRSEVRVLRSHLARGHYFYHPLLARQWIHVCVSLRRLLEYLTCRARRRHLQWYVLAGFAGDDTLRAVFFDVDARGDSTGAVLGQGVALAVEAHDDSTGAVLGQGDMPVWSFWSDSAENCGFSAAACHRWSLTSRSWCRGRFLWFYCSVDQEIPQLQFLYEMIDAPVVQVVFLPVVAHDRRP